MAVRISFEDVRCAERFVENLLEMWRTSGWARWKSPTYLRCPSGEYEIRIALIDASLTDLDRVRGESGASSITLYLPKGGPSPDPSDGFWKKAHRFLAATLCHEVTHVRQKIEDEALWNAGDRARKRMEELIKECAGKGGDIDRDIAQDHWLSIYYTCVAEIEAHAAQIAIEIDRRLVGEPVEIEETMTWKRITKRIGRDLNDAPYKQRMDEWGRRMRTAIGEHQACWRS